jgi:hypothetical protein
VMWLMSCPIRDETQSRHVVLSISAACTQSESFVASAASPMDSSKVLRGEFWIPGGLPANPEIAPLPCRGVVEFLTAAIQFSSWPSCETGSHSRLVFG